MPLILLLFIIVPIVEIAVLLKVGAAIGWLQTLLIVILTAVIGTWMLRQQGLATALAVRQRMQSGQMPANEILEGVLLLVGGALLLTPGFVTDIFGFCCLLPPTRRFLVRSLVKRVAIHGSGVDARSGPFSVNTGSQTSRSAADSSVIDGEWSRKD